MLATKQIVYKSSLSLIREPFAYFQLFTAKKIMRCNKGRNMDVDELMREKHFIQ
jgi:hypothetical protein